MRSAFPTQQRCRRADRGFSHSKASVHRPVPATTVAHAQPWWPASTKWARMQWTSAKPSTPTPRLARASGWRLRWCMAVCGISQIPRMRHLRPQLCRGRVSLMYHMVHGRDGGAPQRPCVFPECLCAHTGVGVPGAWLRMAMVSLDTQTSCPASSVMSMAHTWVLRPRCTGLAVPVTQPERTARR